MFGEFKVFDLKGDLAYEEGVVRRDPSGLIKHKGKYFVWYSKSTGPSQGFGGDIETEKVSLGTDVTFGTPLQKMVGPGKKKDWQYLEEKLSLTMIDQYLPWRFWNMVANIISLTKP